MQEQLQSNGMQYFILVMLLTIGYFLLRVVLSDLKTACTWLYKSYLSYKREYKTWKEDKHK